MIKVQVVRKQRAKIRVTLMKSNLICCSGQKCIEGRRVGRVCVWLSLYFFFLWITFSFSLHFGQSFSSKKYTHTHKNRKMFLAEIFNRSSICLLSMRKTLPSTLSTCRILNLLSSGKVMSCQVNSSLVHVLFVLELFNC